MSILPLRRLALPMLEYKYLTLGAGFKYKKANFDFSYLSSTSKQNGPLDNVMRFSLSFNIDEKGVEPIEEKEKSENN